jgi:phosphohistidine phosphatase
MDLILWRHAEAEAEPLDDDAARPLTAKGVKQATRMGKWLDLHLPGNCRILSSPAVRCDATARHLGRKFRTSIELGTDSTAERIIAAANWPESREPVVLVGHQPLLGQVASLILFGNPLGLELRKANALWISRKPEEESGPFIKVLMGPRFVK